MRYYGWYDPNPSDKGTIALSYWNHVVNEYANIGNNPNDLVRYTKEHYVQACKKYMDEHTYFFPDRKFIIDIPTAEVYYEGTKTASDGYKENIPIWKTTEWIEYVINELDKDERVLGWYQADEPEVWGYREVVNGNVTNSNPPIEYAFLKDRYDIIKSLSTKPVIVVFCDTKLFLDRYYHKILKYGKFFDVFGFDYYPFTPSNKRIDSTRIKNFINISCNIDPNLPILFVGQGSGTSEFNTRTPYLQEHQNLFQEFIKNCPANLRFGYLLWSANSAYADSSALVNGNLALHYLNDWILTTKQPLTKITVPMFTKIINFLKSLFKFKKPNNTVVTTTASPITGRLGACVSDDFPNGCTQTTEEDCAGWASSSWYPDTPCNATHINDSNIVVRVWGYNTDDAKLSCSKTTFVKAVRDTRTGNFYADTDMVHTAPDGFYCEDNGIYVYRVENGVTVDAWLCSELA